MTLNSPEPQRPFARRLALAVLAVLLAAGSPPALAPGTALGASLASDYWQTPLSPQGEAPPHWTETEQSLAPEACAECHADQYREWRTSFHAGAFSPGLVGQLLSFNAEGAASCMKCHAPLAEQRAAFEAARRRGNAHAAAGQGLAAAGNSCAGCHVRARRYHGPPKRDTGAVGPGNAEAPHGGVLRTADFEGSEFCSACHQFPQSFAVNGKPLENTYEEWRASPQAAEGVTCQGCHMPDRKHLWRGIHDPGITASGLTARFLADASGARFELANTGVGHAFPTYITPKVVMRAAALDENGRALAETTVSRAIQRIVEYAGGQWVERSDTRLMPGDTATLFLPWRGRSRARVWLEVYPDDYYDHQVFDQLLAGLPAGGHPARLIAEADSRARASRYRLFETELARPD